MVSYLTNRYITYSNSNADLISKKVHAGVPQGLVLGLLLWNHTYDLILEAYLQPQCTAVCYADDTLILASGNISQLASWRATASAAVVINRILGLGLNVAPQKTTATLFYRGHKILPPVTVNILDEPIVTGDTFKYLGIMFDRRLTFKSHFLYMEEKAARVKRQLWKIMPNLRSLSETKRRLYVNVIHSVLLYAAPVWSEAFGLYKTQQNPVIRI